MTVRATTGEHPHLLANYTRAPVTFVRGEGCWLIDEHGTRYLDFVAGLAVCALGHAHPGIAEAVAQQAARLVHCSNLYHHEPAGLLAGELARISGFARVFFCNSGTEANEAAIKLARKRAFRRGDHQRSIILACTGSFHGRTLGALAATDNPAYHEGFGPLPDGFAFTPFNDIASLERALDARVAALLVEPVQGESGVHPADFAFLFAARRLCDERGALLIFDEIQCGMGRTGRAFAFEGIGVRPDVVTLAKALANGLPIGAVLVDERSADALLPGDHGSTFGGSPVPCAAALAHLRIREELGLDARVADIGKLLWAGLHQIAMEFPSALEEPRGLGMMLGLPIRAPVAAATIVAAALERRLLVNAAGGNTIRVIPPLVLSEDEARMGLEQLRDAVAEVTRSPGAPRR